MVALSVGNTLSVSGGSQVLAPTHDVHFLSGSGSIITITPPSPEFAGLLVLIKASGSGSIDTSGATNIKPTSTLGLITILVYDPGTSYWYWLPV